MTQPSNASLAGGACLAVCSAGLQACNQMLASKASLDNVPDPMNVELICSRIEVESMLCVLSILFRLFVAIEPMIRPTIPNEVITRIAPAIINSIIVMPACGSLFFLSAVIPSMLIRSKTIA